MIPPFPRLLKVKIFSVCPSGGLLGGIVEPGGV